MFFIASTVKWSPNLRKAAVSSMMGCNKYQKRGIVGKAMRGDFEKPTPFPYHKYRFNLFWSLFSRTANLFHENSKIIIVDGAHAVGKTKLAKELAEDLDMLYMPQANMDLLYKNYYGYDMRNYKEYLHDRAKPYDEKDFIRNPIGPVYGCGDRFLFYLYYSHYLQYIHALMHLFNTGQGIVMEKSPFSHYLYVNAAYNMGWIERESRNCMKQMFINSLPSLLRPNLIIYLDAPVDVVQSKIKARGNEWDKDSPVWKSTDYLESIYDGMKQDYLQREKTHSHVLVYDWTEPIETEVVVEDIERLNFDYFGRYESAQSDWKFEDNEAATNYRIRYTRPDILISDVLNVFAPDAEAMVLHPEHQKNLEDVAYYMKGNEFCVGYNADLGDKNILFKTSNHLEELYGFLFATNISSRPYYDKNYLD